MNQRTGAIVLLGVASVALIVALATQSWFRESRDVLGVSTTFGMGLWGNAYQESCGEAVKQQLGKDCDMVSRTIKWSETRGTKNKAWLLFGRLTLIIGFLAVASLIAGIVALVKRHEWTKYIWLESLIAVSTTLVCAGIYLGLQPKVIGELGYSVFVFFPAALAGIFGSLIARDALSARSERPLPGIGQS